MVSRHRPKKHHKSLTIDLTADWTPYAASLPEPQGDDDWRMFGIITIDGLTGGLAWKRGLHALATGTTIRELGLWERIDLQKLIMIDKPAGLEDSPQFAREQTWGQTLGAALRPGSN